MYSNFKKDDKVFCNNFAGTNLGNKIENKEFNIKNRTNGEIFHSMILILYFLMLVIKNGLKIEINDIPLMLLQRKW